MALYEKFGEFDSADEINKLAQNLLKEGDKASIYALAKENGIAKDYADMMVEGAFPALCDATTAAIGKIDVEVEEMKPKGIMVDWVEYIKAVCMENGDIAYAVRRRNKSLKGCIGALLKYAFDHQEKVDPEIIKAAGVKAGRVTFGMAGQKEARKLIREYYGGKK